MSVDACASPSIKVKLLLCLKTGSFRAANACQVVGRPYCKPYKHLCNQQDVGWDWLGVRRRQWLSVHASPVLSIAASTVVHHERGSILCGKCMPGGSSLFCSA